MKKIIIFLLIFVVLLSFYVNADTERSVTYTPNSKITTYWQGRVNAIISAGQVYADSQGTLLKDAPSLLNTEFPIPLSIDLDPRFNITIGDYNYTAFKNVCIVANESGNFPIELFPRKNNSNKWVTYHYNVKNNDVGVWNCYDEIKIPEQYQASVLDIVLKWGDNSTVVSINSTPNMPSVTLEHTGYNRFGFALKLNISSIPSGAIINEAILYIYRFLGSGGLTYADIYRYDNQTWEGVAVVETNLSFQDATKYTNHSFIGTLAATSATWGYIDVTQIVQTDHNLGNNYSSVRVESSDYPIGFEETILVEDPVEYSDGMLIGISATPFDQYASTEMSPSPYLNVTYTLNPRLNILYPSATNVMVVASGEKKNATFLLLDDYGNMTNNVNVTHIYINGSKDANITTNLACTGTLNCDNLVTESACLGCSQCAWNTPVGTFFDDFNTNTNWTGWETATPVNGIYYQLNNPTRCVNDANDDCWCYNRTSAGSNITDMVKDFDISGCKQGTAQLSVRMYEIGTQAATDCIYAFFSNDSGSTYANQTTIFCDDKAATTVTINIDNAYLVPTFRIRLNGTGFETSVKAACLDDITFSCTSKSCENNGSCSACHSSQCQSGNCSDADCTSINQQELWWDALTGWWVNFTTPTMPAGTYNFSIYASYYNVEVTNTSISSIEYVAGGESDSCTPTIGQNWVITDICTKSAFSFTNLGYDLIIGANGRLILTDNSNITFKRYNLSAEYKAGTTSGVALNISKGSTLNVSRAT